MRKVLLSAILVIAFVFVGCPPTAKNSARIYLAKGEYKLAKAQTLAGLKDYPDDYELYALLAKAEIGLHNWISASESFQNAFKKDSLKTLKWMRADEENISVYWQAFYNAAVALQGERRYRDALKNLKYTKLINPSSVNQYILEGGIYYEIGDKESAKRSFTKAISIDPKNPEAYLLIGKSQFENNLFDSSLVNFNEATKYFKGKYNKTSRVIFQNVPEVPKELKHKIIELWIHKKDSELDKLVKEKLGFDGGLNVYRRSIENFFKVTNSFSQSYYYTGMANYRLKKDSLALKNLLKSLELIPDDVNAIFYTGEILLVKFDKYQDALSYFRKLTKLRKDDVDAWFYVGACYLQLKDYQQAINVYENEVITRDPKYVMAYKMLTEAYRSIGKTKKALEYLMKAEELQKEK
jgi:tetratricopeptide (TPR) repeat protein